MRCSVEPGTAAAVEPVVKTATSTSDARAQRNATQKPYDLLTVLLTSPLYGAAMRTLVLAAGWLSLIVLVLPVRVY